MSLIHIEGMEARLHGDDGSTIAEVIERALQDSKKGAT